MGEQAFLAFEGMGGPNDLLSEVDLAKVLGVSRTTLWRLRAAGLPFRSIGRIVRYRLAEVEDWLQAREYARSRAPEPSFAAEAEGPGADELPPCHWSRSVALDPKHRPQEPHKPSSTVRREWWRFPQEAHLLDVRGNRYRRLLSQEVAALQGFPADWTGDADLSELDLIRGYGNAVPPPLVEAMFTALGEVAGAPLATGIEICAGFGGMALGAGRALGLEHQALIEFWEPAVRVLRQAREWPASAVVHGDVLAFPWDSHAGTVDLLSGGPPCQPWSNAGKGMGADDSRDLLGAMPNIVARLRPRAFVFENVPGLLSGENEAYATWLIKQLRAPADGVRYGVAAAVLNAADFGVSQVRRRVFIVGIRDSDERQIHHLFDLVAGRRTHGDPRMPLASGRAPWRTVADAVPGWADVSSGWRRWLGSPTESSIGRSDEGPGQQTSTPGRPKYTRIQLTWPHRDCVPVWSEDGWLLEDAEDPALATRPLLPDGNGDPVENPWMLVGDPVATLVAAQRTYGRKAQLVYVDAPRIKTNAADFESSNSEARLDTWLTLMQTLIARALRLASDDGAVVVLCGVVELPYVQTLMTEAAGPDNYIGTVAWQKGYAPRNMKGMQELSPTHDNLVMFARRKTLLPEVALRVPPAKYSNSDGDPRGAWAAEQKGANKPDCDFDVNIPPYRWKVVSGSLPPGIWQLNPKSGVIWGPGDAIRTSGEWIFAVEVTDRQGKAARKTFTIAVSADAEAPVPAPPSWLVAERTPKGKPVPATYGNGRLQIDSKKLPPAKIGADYSACLAASGGDPWTGTTRPGKTTASGRERYWEFPAKTLQAAAARDAVDFKSKDDAIPVIKTYLPPGQDTVPLNQATTWLGGGKGKDDPFAVGYSEKAKEELQQLLADGHISAVVKTSKPSALMARLVALFTRPRGVVVDIGSPAAEMSAIATALGRRSLYFEFPTNEPFRKSVTLPRLRLAARGEHPLPPGVLVNRAAPSEDSSSSEESGYFVDGAPRAANARGDAVVMSLGPPAGILDRKTSTLQLDYGAYAGGDVRTLAMLASLEGLIPVQAATPECFGVSLDGRLRACYVPSADFLDDRVVSELSERHRTFLESGGRLRVYYHRGLESAETANGAVEFRRIPFDLQLVAGAL